MEHYFHNKNIEDLKNLNLQKQHKVVNKYQNVTSKISGPSKTIEVTTNKSCSNLQRSSKGEKLSNSCKKLSGADFYSTEASSSKKFSKVPERYNSLPKEVGKIRPTHKVINKQNKFKSTANIVQTQFQDSEIKKNEVKLRNQGVQTLDDNKLENLYTEGIIRYFCLLY